MILGIAYSTGLPTTAKSTLPGTRQRHRTKSIFKAALRGCFHLSIVLTAPGSAVALGAMIENFLRRRNIGSLAFPRLQRRILQGASIREANLPRMGTHGVHRVEMLRGAFGALASGKERDPWDRRRHCTL